MLTETNEESGSPILMRSWKTSSSMGQIYNVATTHRMFLGKTFIQ